MPLISTRARISRALWAISGASPDANYTARDILESAFGLGQDIATSNFLFSYSGTARRIIEAFPSQYLMEEQYAGEHADSVVRVVPLASTSLLLLLAVALAWHVRGPMLRRGGAPLTATVIWLLGLLARRGWTIRLRSRGVDSPASSSVDSCFSHRLGTSSGPPSASACGSAACGSTDPQSGWWVLDDA
jgi:hypothetical protein